MEVYLANGYGISLKSYELMVTQAGGRKSLGYIRLYQKNYLRTRRQKQMAYGEARYILNYFSEQHLKNPSFFFLYTVR